MSLIKLSSDSQTSRVAFLALINQPTTNTTARGSLLARFHASGRKDTVLKYSFWSTSKLGKGRGGNFLAHLSLWFGKSQDPQHRWDPNVPHAP